MVKTWGERTLLGSIKLINEDFDVQFFFFHIPASKVLTSVAGY